MQIVSLTDQTIGIQYQILLSVKNNRKNNQFVVGSICPDSDKG